MILRKFATAFAALIVIGFLSACDSSEERAEKHFQSAMSLLENGDTDRAIVEFRNVFKLNDEHHDARIAFAELHRQRGNFRGSIVQYQRLVEQFPDDLDGWIVPAGGKNEADVLAYLKFATDTQRLADQAKYISYGPARASSAPMVGKHESLGIEMGPHMPTAPANAGNTLLYNYEFWADNVDDLTEVFQAWLAN